MVKKVIIPEDVFIADDAQVLGDVIIGKNSSIWFKTVVRGDVNTIKIGEGTNIQDHCTVHVSKDASTEIGNYVTVGHRAIIHGCKIGDNTLIGMGAIILDHAEIGENCIIGAGTVITENMVIPSKTLVVGVPGKWVRQLTKDEIDSIHSSAVGYIELWRNYYRL